MRDAVEVTRTGIALFELQRGGAPLGQIDLRRPVRLAPGEVWPNEDEAQSSVTVGGERYFAWWERRSEGAFFVERRVTLTAGRGATRTAAIFADLRYEGWRPRWTVHFGEARYELALRSRWRFLADLSAGGRPVLALRETSGFWTLGRRTYRLEPASPLDPVVSAFALLLAITTFGGG